MKVSKRIHVTFNIEEGWEIPISEGKSIATAAETVVKLAREPQDAGDQTGSPAEWLAALMFRHCLAN
ncbi:MAG: hypothetical protein L0Y58_08260 [Verrucomicrobia subdivision 3 bacterium]|nr:hypothetical protein [Limisphaerales bacterium]